MLNAFIRGAMFLFCVTLPMGALAHEVETSQGVVCNTKDQIERFALSSHTASEIVAINAENQNACGVVDVAFVRGEQVSRIRTHDATYGIFAITIIGVVTPHGINPVKPTQQFTLTLIDEREA
jgi:thiamine biosynthesis lipoprotein ApbE